MKRKQTTALILAALITASMAGCQSGSAEQTAPQVTAGAAEQTDVLESTSEQIVTTIERLVDDTGQTVQEEYITIAGQSVSVDATELRIVGDLYNLENTDIDLKGISKLKKLKKLELNNCSEHYIYAQILNADELKQIALEELSVCCVKFSDNENMGFDLFTELTTLKKLSINQYYDVGVNWDFLYSIDFIEELSLFRCDIENLMFVNSMKKLVTLKLQNTAITNYNDLDENNTIKVLEIVENTYVTDISGVSKLKSLEYLYLSESRFDGYEDEVAALRKALIDCEIEEEC